MAAPDQIWINGDVRTSDPETSKAQAFAVENGKFVAVGSNDEISALANETTDIQDLNGKAVLPGIIDNHFHLSSWAFFSSGVNLVDTDNLTVWLERVGARASMTPKGELVFGAGWRLNDSAELPTAAQLDAVAPDHPVLLVDGDYHNIWVNSKLLAQLDITAETPDPPGGEIVKDPETGNPTGILKEAAMRGGLDLVDLALANLQQDKWDTLWQEAMAYANSLGITGMHNMGDAREAEELILLVERQQFPLRMWFGSFVRSGEEVEEILPLYHDVNRRAKQQQDNGPRLAYGYIKTIADGVVSTHTALLTDDYTDLPGEKGSLVLPQDTVADIIARANVEDIPVAVHAIGDAAVAATLDAFAASPKRPSLLNRIEHAELVRPDDIKRFAPLGVAASMQPYHAISGSKYYSTRVGEARHEMAWSWREFLDSGANLTFGSDWPSDFGISPDYIAGGGDSSR